MLCSVRYLEGLLQHLSAASVYVSGTFPGTDIQGTYNLFSRKPGESYWGETGNHHTHTENSIIKYRQESEGWGSCCSFSFRRQRRSALPHSKLYQGENHQDRSVFNHNTEVGFPFLSQVISTMRLSHEAQSTGQYTIFTGAGKTKVTLFLTLESF